MLDEAVILAGGFGTRLRDVVSDLPKPMAPVCGKPFLHYLLRYLEGQGIRRVVLSVGYMHEKIEAYFGKRYGGIDVDYFIEHEPLGTGGGIRAALTKCTSKQVLVLNGDSFFEIPLLPFFTSHATAAADASLALRHVEDASRYGTVITQESNVTHFREKTGLQQPGDINAGVYILPRQRFLEETPEGKNFSIEREFFEPMIGVWKLHAYAADGYFIDIGIPADYHKANEDFRHFRY